ncbi:MAG: ribonuclease Z [Actinomycetota bacterium]|nr:ribonuclease Z [Actinomycetota bacterium]
MKITLLGTGSPIPDAARAGAATLVQSDGATMLVDCGRGVVMRLTGAGVIPPMLNAVLLTHLHSDHITDLNDVITTHWVMCPGPTTLRIFGPPGTRAVVDATLAALAHDVQYRIAHHDDLNTPPQLDVTEVVPGDVFAVGTATIRVAATDHRPVEPSVAFRVDDGGRSAVLGGDGIPCAGLDELCAGADVYVQTVLREDLVRLVPSARFQDILDYHSTVEDAAKTAARAGVRTLVLTHYIPALQPGQEDDWRKLASEHFTGDIVLGDDLTRVDI